MGTPFEWLNDATVKIAATTSGTDRAALLAMQIGEIELELYNSGTNIVFVRQGTDATVTASSTAPDKPIPPGGRQVLAVQNPSSAPITHVAAVTASGTATLYITTGALVSPPVTGAAGQPIGLLLALTKAS
jgi:hypothetical protein